MSPSYAWLPPATALFIACLLGSVCSAKKEKERTGPGAKEHFQTGVGRAKHIESPTNVNARVFCNNTVEVTWEYDPLELLNIDGFFTVLCLEDGSNCFNKSILSDETGIVYDHAVYSTIYQESVFAYKGGKYSTPAQATFTTYPKIPDLEDLTITAISPRELKALWGRKWKDNIEFSLCTVEEPCQNETVPGDELEHIFNDLKPGTMYTVSAQAEATLKGRTCKGNVHKDNAATLPLPAPTNLAVTLSCDGNVEATWQYDAHAGIEGFITQLCHKDGSACQNKTLLASSRNTNYTVTEPDTSFYISVRAFVDEGYTSRADEVSFTSFPKLPDLDDLTVRGISPTEVKATWSDAWNGDIEFVICRESAQCENQTVRGDLHSYTLSDLEPDTEYSVSAQAEISWLHKTCKGHKQERGTSTLRIEPPKNLSVDVSCANEASVKWKYDDEKHVNGFVIRLCYGVDEEHCDNETVSNTVRSHSFALPEANALYNVTMWAYYSTNKSNKSFSLPAEANFTSYPDLPELRSVTVKGVSTTQLLATWQDEWAADVYFTICSSPTECRKDTAQGIQHNHTFSGLQENTTYTVATKTGATLNNKTCYGHEQNRTAATFVTRPGKIQNLKAKIVNGTLLEVAWDAPKSEENVSGYTIECSDDHTHYNESRDIHGGKKSNDVSFILHEVSATFNCSVRAFNLDTNGHRVYGPPESFDVTTDGIDVPKDVTLVKATATSLTYMWSADSNATKCEVELHKEGKYEESLGRIESCGESVNGTVTHNVTDLDPWTAYNVSIKNCRDTFCGKPAFAVSNTAVAAPSEVRNFSYVISKYVNVHFSWKVPEHANGPLDGYMLRIFDEDAQEVKLISLPGKDNNTRTDLKFQFHLFNVSLTAFNYDNTTNATLYGPESELKFETLGEGPMPPRPKTEDVNETSVQLSWEEPEDPRYNITAFQVQVTGQTPFTTTALNVTIDHLNPWTNYEVNVSSCTNKTDCGQERHFHFKTDFGAPSAPRDFKAPSAGTHWMLIQWEKPEVLNGPLSGYNLTFSHGGSQIHAITTELSYNATDLVPGTNYEVAVFAFNEVESVIKNGPAVTLQASTQADTPSQAGASTATIVLAVLIPLIFLLLIAAFFLYKRYQNKTGERTPLTSAVDS